MGWSVFFDEFIDDVFFIFFRTLFTSIYSIYINLLIVYFIFRYICITVLEVFLFSYFVILIRTFTGFWIPIIFGISVVYIWIYCIKSWLMKVIIEDCCGFGWIYIYIHPVSDEYIYIYPKPKQSSIITFIDGDFNCT